MQIVKSSFAFLCLFHLFVSNHDVFLDEKALAILAIFQCISTAAQRIQIYCLKSANCFFLICRIRAPPETRWIGKSQKTQKWRRTRRFEEKKYLQGIINVTAKSENSIFNICRAALYHQWHSWGLWAILSPSWFSILPVWTWRCSKIALLFINTINQLVKWLIELTIYYHKSSFIVRILQLYFDLYIRLLTSSSIKTKWQNGLHFVRPLFFRRHFAKTSFHSVRK